MSSPYTKDLELEVTYKLQSNDVFSISILSKQWSTLIAPEFWIAKFIRSFGTSLPNGVNYEMEYIVIEKIGLIRFYRYVVNNDYIKLLAYMLDKWKIPKDLIITAAIHGRLELIKFLLDNGADIHAQEDYALRCAASNGHLEVVKILLANGALIHIREDETLKSAAERGHLEVVKFLLANGANIHAKNELALRWAAKNGHLEVVKVLLANGANIHAKHELALRWAAQNGHLEVVKLLLSNGALIHAENDYALISAAANGHLEVIKLLLDNGADVTAIQNNKYTKEINSLIENYNKDV